MSQNILKENMTDCQFLRRLYAIKTVVVGLLLVYDIIFFKIVFNVFPRTRFLKHFSQT